MEILVQKLTSRKFWLSIVGTIIGIVMIACDMPQEGSAVIIASICGGIGAEGIIDACRALATKIVTTNTTAISATVDDKKTVQDALKKDE